MGQSFDHPLRFDVPQFDVAIPVLPDGQLVLVGMEGEQTFPLGFDGHHGTGRGVGGKRKIPHEHRAAIVSAIHKLMMTGRQQSSVMIKGHGRIGGECPLARARPDVPHDDFTRCVVLMATRGSQAASVRAEGDVVQRMLVAFQGMSQGAVLQIPQYQLPAAPRCEQLAIGTERDRLNGFGVAAERVQYLLRRDVPDFDRAVFRAARDLSSIADNGRASASVKRHGRRITLLLE